ncbi:hypothetical protein PENSPDRAFT_693646 [Peniophora sp. CONT]|nr:hypothetical protein PENSPDRAFT_693646 [Peniophora sp. CONT]
MAVSILAGELAGFVVETFLVGAYYAVFFLGLHAIFSERFRRGSVWIMLRSPINLSYFVIFACVTANWIIDVVKLFDAFLYKEDKEPLLVYAVASNGNRIAQTMVYLTEIFCADAILVYRLLHIYKRSLAIIALPVCTITVTLGETTALTEPRLDDSSRAVASSLEIRGFTSGKEASGASVWLDSPNGKWVVIGFMATFVTNVYCTSLIALRVWKSHAATRQMKTVRQSSASRIVQVIVESAAIYSACIIFVTVAYCAQSYLYVTAFEAAYPIAGMVFSSIIIRIRLFGRADTATTVASEHFAPAAHQLQPISVAIRRDEISAESDNQTSSSFTKVNVDNV